MESGPIAQLANGSAPLLVLGFLQFAGTATLDGVPALDRLAVHVLGLADVVRRAVSAHTAQQVRPVPCEVCIQDQTLIFGREVNARRSLAS